MIANRNAAGKAALSDLDRGPQPHRAVLGLEHRGKLDTLVSPNIDGLRQLAGNDPAKVVEILGTIREVACMTAGSKTGRGPPSIACGLGRT